MAPRVRLFSLGLMFQVFVVNCKPTSNSGGCFSSSVPTISSCLPSHPSSSFGSNAGSNGCNVHYSPSIPFSPVPQPVPAQIPFSKQQQSVTIPNIIVALLPPNQNKVSPPPVAPAGPTPNVFPWPQPRPVPVRDCRSSCG